MQLNDTTQSRVLVVDDDGDSREMLYVVLEDGGFDVRSAANVNEALKLIASETFDVLVSDVHVPHEGDGFTIVNAMRHANPEAVTFIINANPEMKKAAEAILSRTNAVIVKSDAVANLVPLIWERLKTGSIPVRALDSVATILEDETQVTIEDWLSRVCCERHIITVSMDDDVRCAHLPQLFRDLVSRLRNPLPLGSYARASPAAVQHGLLRREQGYTAAMMVEESRMLQVSIFQTLQNNLSRVNFSLLMVGVMTIADEVDSQLAQAMSSYVAESKVDDLPTSA